MTTERLELREIEQGRSDARTHFARALVEHSCAKLATMRRNRALVLAGLKLHVEYLRQLEQREEEATRRPWHSYEPGEWMSKAQ